ncbi:MAG: RNA pseudouridine synthase [Firmicutes bacterium]|nr:RNA pseudouridine synthase [Bacillota bacterium]
MKKLNIIYEDKELLVIDKPSGQLTIGTDKDKFNSLYHEVREYIRKKNQKVFIVNRLDKDTSGIVVFAKNESLKSVLQNNWNNIAKRYYYAIVEGKTPKKSDTLKNYLDESKTLQVYVTNQTKTSKLAILDYKVINELSKYTLLDINIKTGRKNQIRCQLDYIGNPIIGDKKYSSKVNPINRLGLHTYKVILTNPINHKTYEFIAKTPKLFLDYFSKK